MPTITIMKPYVGMANAVPDSRRPRRLIAVSSDHRDDRDQRPCASATNGTTEPRLATPEETDTATVST